jgi:hypothetical protein
MRSMKRWIGLMAAVGISTGCDNPRRNAEAALEAADSAVAAVTPEASKVMPEQLGPLSARISTARNAFNERDYEGALAGARDVQEMAQRIQDSIPGRLTVLRQDLDTLAVYMPRNLDAIKQRIDRADRSGRPPRGLSAEKYAEVKDIHTSATREWPSVDSTLRAGDVGAAFAKAVQLRNRVSEALLALGLATDDRAWGNLQVRPQ